MYEFTEDWFSRQIPIWSQIFQAFPPLPKRILEVGSFEGRSAIWMIENLKPDVIHCIDTWSGGREHDDVNMSEVERRFDRNMARAMAPTLSIHKHKDLSSIALARLLGEGAEPFDYIYLDGSHEACDVVVDLALCMELCRPGGLICCDDYIWRWSDDGSPTQCPKMAIDAVLACNYGRAHIIMNVPLYQVFIRKNI